MTIHLSDAAAEHIKALLTDAYDIGLRIAVTSGGCSGYQYKFNIEVLSGTNEDDIIVEHNAAKLYVDPESAKKLDGATIDYVKALMFQEFVVDNPNSQTCGCGKSFT